MTDLDSIADSDQHRPPGDAAQDRLVCADKKATGMMGEIRDHIRVTHEMPGQGTAGLRIADVEVCNWRVEVKVCVDEWISADVGEHGAGCVRR